MVLQADRTVNPALARNHGPGRTSGSQQAP
jgi:hypothetical protein